MDHSELLHMAGAVDDSTINIVVVIIICYYYEMDVGARCRLDEPGRAE